MNRLKKKDTIDISPLKNVLPKEVLNQAPPIKRRRQKRPDPGEAYRLSEFFEAEPTNDSQKTNTLPVVTTGTDLPKKDDSQELFIGPTVAELRSMDDHCGYIESGINRFLREYVETHSDCTTPRGQRDHLAACIECAKNAHNVSQDEYFDDEIFPVIGTGRRADTPSVSLY